MTSYTALPTVTTGELWTAADHNTYIKDNFAATRQVAIFTPAVGGYNTSDSVELEITSGLRGFEMIDNKSTRFNGFYWIPEFYSGSILTVKAVMIPNASGNVDGQLTAEYGASGEAYDNHTASSGYVLTACAGNDYVTITADLSLGSAAQGDLINLIYYRDGSSATDSINASVYGIGFLIIYNEYANF